MACGLEVRRLEVFVESGLREKFPDFPAMAVWMSGLDNSRYAGDLEGLEANVYGEIRRRYSLEELKDVAVFRAYRDFFWRLGIDPTKLRPSSEALVRRILMGKPLPRINPLVDAYNLASALTGITMAAYDASKVRGELRLTWARRGESFKAIGRSDVMILTGSEVVLRDDASILSIYPYRDSEHTKTERSTREAILVTCGVPGIDVELLREAEEAAVRFIELLAVQR
jgi:DNA/RNA-binding domain of Phe-tRNA-synthetase-like protein